MRQSLLAYPQYTGSGLQGSPLGNTWYDSFQLNVTQRSAMGSASIMNYNYSKNLDTITSNRTCSTEASSKTSPSTIFRTSCGLRCNTRFRN